MTEIRLLHVAGARPNFMKVAPVMAAVDAWNAGLSSVPQTSAGAGDAPLARFSLADRSPPALMQKPALAPS